MEGNIDKLFGAFLGFATIIIIAFISYKATFTLRRRVYGKAKNKSAIMPFPLPVIPSVKHTVEENNKYKTISRLLRSHHSTSRNLQDGAVANLVASSTTLFVAFICLVASVTVLKSWSIFHIYSASLDFSALAIVIWAFLQSSRLRRAWIKERVLSEFARQWLDSQFLFSNQSGDITSQYNNFITRTKTALERFHINKAAFEYGRIRLLEIRSDIAATPLISNQLLCCYLQHRPIKQAIWFARSQARIKGQTEFREMIMASLFIFALITAFLKILAIFSHADIATDWATLALTVVIGLGTAATSSYFGQNLRPLYHRYSQQLRSIELWFDDHADIFKLLDTHSSIQQGSMERFANAAEDFEKLMLFELLDWISISQHNMMELAPI